MRQERLLELIVWEHIPGWRVARMRWCPDRSPRDMPHTVIIQLFVAHLDDLKIVPAPGSLIIDRLIWLYNHPA